jgi:hypothetical protein
MYLWHCVETFKPGTGNFNTYEPTISVGANYDLILNQNYYSTVLLFAA